MHACVRVCVTVYVCLWNLDYSKKKNEDAILMEK